jgi:methyltransferase (TIGR00027 family)
MSPRPSQTALISASHRALHQSLDGGAIFRDPFAVPILGSDAAPFLEQARDDPIRQYWVLHFAGRSRFAEDAAEAALNQGVRQIVILGAGYDTYAYRAKTAPNARVFEVDQPARQLRKLERVARAGIPIPANLAFVSIDFEHEALADRLIEAGFAAALPSFFIWLGVVYYLTEGSIAATLRYIGSLPVAQIVFDYITALPEDLSPELKAQAEAMNRRTEALGEPVKTRLDTETLHAELKALGLNVVEDLAPADIFNRFLGQTFPGVHPTRGWRFVSCRDASARVACRTRPNLARPTRGVSVLHHACPATGFALYGSSSLAMVRASSLSSVAATASAR